MRTSYRNEVRALLVDVQRRLPSGQRFIQEAFTSDHRHAVMMKVTELRPDTFYFFDEITVHAFRDTVIDLAARHPGDRLTISYLLPGEFSAQQHRLQHLTNKLAKIQVLAVGSPRGGEQIPRLDFFNIKNNPLAKFTVTIQEGKRPLLFICRELSRHRSVGKARNVGFYSFDADTVEEMADDIEQLRRGMAARLTAFDRLELLHQTTQRVARELESYMRRIDLAVKRARRRPDLLTPARFERIVGQTIAKIEQLQEIPLRALRAIEKSSR